MVKQILDMLRQVQPRPGMWMGDGSFVPVQAFLIGIRMTARLSGVEYTHEEYDAAVRSRGWRTDGAAAGIRYWLERGGLDARQMATELVAVEIAAWELVLCRPESPDAATPSPTPSDSASS